jgi:TonB-linked SusC/RagA family outer membrane protein
MKHVVVSFFIFSISAIFTFSFSQRIVTGKVISASTGEDIPSATVMITGTAKGVTTDIDGNFKIEVPQDLSQLEVCFIGYEPYTLALNESNEYTVELQSSSINLDQVVVVGYGTQKSKDLTSPISVVQGSDLGKIASPNATQALQGKVAGVQIINSGAPGAGATVKIRGVGSIGDYGQPLYVVDGMFVDNLDFISADNIETMSILKDASAAAIYGVKAANGVVIVTTKKGMEGKPVISYDGSVSVQVPVNIVPMTNKEQYIDFWNLANQNVTGWTPRNPNNYPANTNWYKELIGPAIMHNHSIDVSGATESTNYSVGLNYFSQDGTMKVDNNYERLSIRGRFEQKATKWLSVGASILFTNFNQKSEEQAALRQAYVNPPVYPVYNSDNTSAYPVNFDSPQRYGYPNSFGNPVAAAYYRNNRTKGNRFLASAFADINIWKDKLKFRSSYNVDFHNTINFNYQPENFVGGSQGTAHSNLTEKITANFNQIIDNVFTYSDSKNKHSYTVTLGQSTRMFKQNFIEGTAKDVPNTDEQSIYLKTGSAKDRNNNDGAEMLNGLSAFARATYNYGEKYLLSATFRADASSKYQQKWGYFPSFGAGWVISEEDFMKKSKGIDFFKLRVSWGMLGNDNVPANSGVALALPGIGSSAVFGDNLVDGLGQQTKVAPNYLKWEVVSEWNVGLDFAFLNKRLTAEIDYYYRVTNNVVYNAPVSGTTDELLGNYGKVLNTGVEFSLGWKDRAGSNFSYNINLNATTIHNKVLELDGREFLPGAQVTNGYATRTQAGHPIGSFYGYRMTGIAKSHTEGDIGYPIYFDKDGNGITPDDMVFLGSPIPYLIGGLEFGCSYNFGKKAGAIDFGISFYGQAGNKIFNQKRMNRSVFPDGNYDLNYYNNAYTSNNKNGIYPSPEAFNRSIVQQPNSFFVEDGSFLRIQNIQIGYTITGIPKISSLRIYLSADRPYSLFSYNGFSPEVSKSFNSAGVATGSPITSGIDNNIYPMSAIYSVGLKLSF